MTDFTSMEETMGFFLLGPMKPADEMPLMEIDHYFHGEALLGVGVDSADYRDLQQRFLRTFRPDASAPGGGDIGFISEELIEYFKKGGVSNGKENSDNGKN